MQGNIDRIQSFLDQHTEITTVEQIVDFELKANTHSINTSVTKGVLWLKRAIDYVNKLLVDLSTTEEELTVCATNAYNSTLYQYHGWITAQLFTLAMKAVPWRADFFDSLKKEATVEVMLVEMKEYVGAIEKSLPVLHSLMVAKG